MRRTFAAFVFLWATALPAVARQAGEDSTLYTSAMRANQIIDSGWVVSFPTGSSDFFSVAYNVVPGIGNSESLADGLPVTGVAVAIADFGTTLTYPTAGLYNPNLGLDATGNTPNLSSAIGQVVSPSLPSPPELFGYHSFFFTPALVPGGSTKVVSAVQLPPGDSGTLGIGADSNVSTALSSGFTTDGYSTPAIIASFLDFGISVAQDNTATTSCKQAARLPHGRLRGNYEQDPGDQEANRLTVPVIAGNALSLFFFGTKTGDKFRLYFNVAPCTAAVAIGPVLPTLPDPDGSGSYLRINTTWPFGFGGQTFRFSAVWGNPACATPGVGFTNCVTIISAPDPAFGICDDGTVESGWVVQIPSGSSDYFNNNFGVAPAAVNGVVGLTIAVLDFGTSAVGYPTSGVSLPNLGLDPSCNTPDIASPLATVNPFTFPPGSFETTSASFTSHAVSVPASSFAGQCLHGWVQFPPGDPGLLAVGADSSATNGCSFFSLDGYSTPAISFFVNWCIRLNTN